MDCGGIGLNHKCLVLDTIRIMVKVSAKYLTTLECSVVFEAASQIWRRCPLRRILVEAKFAEPSSCINREIQLLLLVCRAVN